MSLQPKKKPKRVDAFEEAFEPRRKIGETLFGRKCCDLVIYYRKHISIKFFKSRAQYSINLSNLDHLFFQADKGTWTPCPPKFLTSVTLGNLTSHLCSLLKIQLVQLQTVVNSLWKVDIAANPAQCWFSRPEPVQCQMYSLHWTVSSPAQNLAPVSALGSTSCSQLHLTIFPPSLPDLSFELFAVFFYSATLEQMPVASFSLLSDSVVQRPTFGIVGDSSETPPWCLVDASTTTS